LRVFAHAFGSPLSQYAPGRARAQQYRSYRARAQRYRSTPLRVQQYRSNPRAIVGANQKAKARRHTAAAIRPGPQTGERKSAKSAKNAKA
jgi:hypothetical protein